MKNVVLIFLLVFLSRGTHIFKNSLETARDHGIRSLSLNIREISTIFFPNQTYKKRPQSGSKYFDRICEWYRIFWTINCGFSYRLQKTKLHKNLEIANKGIYLFKAQTSHTHRSEIREPSYRAFFLSDRTYAFRQWTLDRHSPHTFLFLVTKRL